MRPAGRSQRRRIGIPMQKHADATREGAKNPIDPVFREGQNRGPSPGFVGPGGKHSVTGR